MKLQVIIGDNDFDEALDNVIASRVKYVLRNDEAIKEKIEEEINRVVEAYLKRTIKSILCNKIAMQDQAVSMLHKDLKREASIMLNKSLQPIIEEVNKINVQELFKNDSEKYF